MFSQFFKKSTWRGFLELKSPSKFHQISHFLKVLCVLWIIFRKFFSEQTLLNIHRLFNIDFIQKIKSLSIFLNAEMEIL